MSGVQDERHYTYRISPIPPYRSTYNGDVENVNNLIEDEFYKVESFQSPGDLLNKSYVYQIYFINSSFAGDKKRSYFHSCVIKSRDE